MNPPDQPTQPTEAHADTVRKIGELLLVRADKEAAQLIADSEARAVERATLDAQTAGNALFYAIYERMKRHFPDGSRDLDWDVLPSTIGATCKALTTEREKVRVLREALEHYRHCVIAGGTNPARAALAATEVKT